MEERYDEDTVELIDYLRTMWWGKWIILGCLVVAVGLSVLFVSLQSTTYSGSTEILLREYVTAALAEDRTTTVAIIFTKGVMAGTLAAVTDAVPGIVAGLAVDDVMPGVAASLVAVRITLSRSDAESAAAVREALAQAEIALEQQLLLTLTKELGHLAKMAQFERSALVAQLDILRQRLREEQAIAGVPLLEALAGQIAQVEAQLAEQQVRLDMLETAEPSTLLLCSLIGKSTSTASEPNRKTTIGVSGFLGLMIGVLLAFFVHYLLQVRVRERRAAKDEPAL